MNININDMLVNDSIWLAEQAVNSTEKFLEVAEKIELRQSDWTRVWNRINKKMYEVHIGKKVMEMDAGELQYTRQFYGVIDEVSNCCAGEVKSGRCEECGEKCKTIYVVPR